MTPRLQMSQDLSYFSGPRTSGAAYCEAKMFLNYLQSLNTFTYIWRVARRLKGFLDVGLFLKNEKKTLKGQKHSSDDILYPPSLA